MTNINNSSENGNGIMFRANARISNYSCGTRMNERERKEGEREGGREEDCGARYIYGSENCTWRLGRRASAVKLFALFSLFR